jgi:signal recognition particle GTPase
VRAEQRRSWNGRVGRGFLKELVDTHHERRQKWVTKNQIQYAVKKMASAKQAQQREEERKKNERQEEQERVRCEKYEERMQRISKAMTSMVQLSRDCLEVEKSNNSTLKRTLETMMIPMALNAFQIVDEVNQELRSELVKYILVPSAGTQKAIMIRIPVGTKDVPCASDNQ